jgi:aminoglycoside phosphotransferase (APT) family kinase protein
MAGVESAIPGLEQPAVEAWLVANVEGTVAPVEFSVVSGGHSNITYGAIDTAGNRLVIRRPPLGQIVGKGHDVGREHRIIAAVGTTGVPVPPVRGNCVDPSVTGAPFYVMDWVDGHVV